MRMLISGKVEKTSFCLLLVAFGLMVSTIPAKAEGITKRAVVVEKFTPKGCDVREQDISRLHSLLIDKVANTRKFEVFERDDDKLRTLMKEISLHDAGVTDGDGPESNKMRAAGYKVLGNVLRHYSGCKALNGVFVYSAAVELQLRFENIETAKILSSKTIKADFSRKVFEKDDDVGAKVMDVVVDKAAGNVVNALVDVVFPITVLKVRRGTITVNATRAQIKKGDVFDVFELGDEPLIDPVTKENLGFDEEFVGRVVVTRPGDKTSQCVVADDNTKPEDIEKGMILRKTSEDDLKEVKKAKATEKPSRKSSLDE